MGIHSYFFSKSVSCSSDSMVNLRGIGAVFGLIAVGGIFISTCDNHWQVSVPNNGMGGTIVFEMHQGLWEQCQTMPGKTQQCSGYAHGIQHLPSGLVAQRAMMVMACALGSIAVLGSIASTDAVNAVKTSAGKRQVCLMAAALFFITCVLSVSSVSWEAYNIIVRHQFEPGMPQMNLNTVHYTIGMDIYIGWVAGFLCLLVSVALCFGGCNADDEEEKYNNYNMSENSY